MFFPCSLGNPPAVQAACRRSCLRCFITTFANFSTAEILVQEGSMCLKSGAEFQYLEVWLLCPALIIGEQLDFLHMFLIPKRAGMIQKTSKYFTMRNFKCRISFPKWLWFSFTFCSADYFLHSVLSCQPLFMTNSISRFS